jgi:hypothetical protein
LCGPGDVPFVDDREERTQVTQLDRHARGA